MGKAYYRKYRSKSLLEVVGQHHITDTLQRALDSGKISHAYLFTGPRGVGKTSVARILAHEINDLPYTDESTHLDIIEIDAASNRRIDEIRDLREKVHIAPTSAKYKVYIIDEVHMLTREAFNALLKTLEEPPEHVVFILATTEAHKLPDTIISRTQQYSFKPIEQAPAVRHLRSIADKEKLNITDEALEVIAAHGKGSFRDSISMLDQISGVQDKNIDKNLVSMMLGVPNQDLIEQLIGTLKTSDTKLLFDTTQKLKEQGASATNTAQMTIDMMRKNVLADSDKIPVKRTVSVMKTLLPLTGSHASFEAIEIAFLDAFEFTQNQIDATTKVDTTTQNKMLNTEVKPDVGNNTDDNSQVETTLIEIKSPDVLITEQSDSQTNDEWLSILNALKGSHNTLYGVLRMAKADISDESITLTFAFEFHKKQLNQNKNIAILDKVITKTLGKQKTIAISVEKPEKKATNNLKPKNYQVEEAINNVSNIFGGAELLES